MTIRELRSLHTPRGRALHRSFLAEGWRIVDGIVAHMAPQEIFVTSEHLERARKIFSSVHVHEVSERVMKSLSQATTPSGIVARFAIPQATVPTKLYNALVLAQISDPGNMGTLIRSAAALAVSAVVVVEGVDPWNHKVIQASAGAIAAVPILSLSWDEFRKHSSDAVVCQLVVDGGVSISSLSQQELNRAIFVVGNEAHGIPAEWIASTDRRVTLPMPGGTESLNAAVAGSLALYLAYLQRTGAIRSERQ